jgi:hypothetical protein
MANQKVELEVSGSSLILSGDVDHLETIHVDSNSTYRSVIWNIKNEDALLQFRIIGKMNDNPFEDPIPKKFDTDLRLKVKKGKNIVWDYAIEWMDKNGEIQKRDPKISIYPSKKDFLPVWIASIATAIVGVLAISLFWQKKKWGK